MAAGEDGDQELLHDLILADDLARDLRADLVVGRSQFLQLGEIELIGPGARGQGRRPSPSAGRSEDT